MNADSLDLPRNLIDGAQVRATSGDGSLPAIVRTLERRWNLEIGVPFQPGGRARGWLPPVTDTVTSWALK